MPSAAAAQAVAEMVEAPRQLLMSNSADLIKHIMWPPRCAACTVVYVDHGILQHCLRTSPSISDGFSRLGRWHVASVKAAKHREAAVLAS